MSALFKNDTHRPFGLVLLREVVAPAKPASAATGRAKLMEGAGVSPGLQVVSRKHHEIIE